MINTTKEELNKLINTEKKSYSEIGRIFGCSDNGIKKIAKRLGVKLPIRNKGNKTNELTRGGKMIKPSQYSICPICGKRKWSTSKLCKSCSDKSKRTIADKKLGDYVGYDETKTYKTRLCQEIRKHAKKVLYESGVERVCCYCKNHEFDEILEVHHLKNILSFSPETTIKIINDTNNLVWICPNHHAMLEKGFINLDK